MSKAIIISKTGGPEALEWKDHDPGILAAKGSLFLTRPSLMAYTARRKDLLDHAKDLFDHVLQGAINIRVGQTYPLADAALAHTELEARKTKGSSILTI